MRKGIEEKSLTNRRLGVIGRIETIYQMKLKKLLKHSTDLGSLESIPYAITKEYKSVMIDLERARARAQLEYSRSGIR